MRQSEPPPHFEAEAKNDSFTGPYLMIGGQQWVDRRAIEVFRPKDTSR